jgi:hypothetical protein
MLYKIWYEYLYISIHRGEEEDPSWGGEGGAMDHQWKDQQHSTPLGHSRLSRTHRSFRAYRPGGAQPSPVLQGVVDCLMFISNQMLRMSGRYGKNGGWPWNPPPLCVHSWLPPPPHTLSSRQGPSYPSTPLVHSGLGCGLWPRNRRFGDNAGGQTELKTKRVFTPVREFPRLLRKPYSKFSVFQCGQVKKCRHAVLACLPGCLYKKSQGSWSSVCS